MKKLLIRVFCFMLCMLMIVPLASCNDTEDKPNTNTDGSTNDNTNDNANDNTNDNTGNNGGDNTGGTDVPPAPPVDTREEVDMDKLIELLTSSIYSANVKTNDFVGLTDPSLVGINKDKFEEILYPIPADSECSLVINVKDRGILPNGEDCYTAFRDVLREVRGKDGIKKIVFPEGEYKFSKTFELDGLEDLYICSEGNDKYFSIVMTTWSTAFKVTNCKNIHFNNFDFDLETPSIVTGTVVSQSGNKIVVKVDEGYDLTKKDYNGGKVGHGSYMEFRYDEATGRYVPNSSGNLLYNSTGDPWNNAMEDGKYDAATRQLTLTFKEDRVKSVAAGVKVNVAYTMYEPGGFRASGGENIYLEGVTFYHTLGMAVGADGVNNVYLNRFKLTPKEGRLMTATADGFHCGSCTGEIVVTNSVFEYSHDDCFNIKGGYGKVVSNLPKAISYDNSKKISVAEGDVLDFYSSTDFRYLGTYTVKSINSATNMYYTKEVVTEDLTGAYFMNDTQISSLTVRNSYFGNKRNRGMLIQCRDVEISGCTFQNIIHPSLQIFSAADSFAEGVMPRNVVIKNNKFLNNISNDINVFTSGPDGAVSNTILGVEVSNNFFFGNNSRPISYQSVGSSKITDNFIYKFRASLDSVISVSISENVEIARNYIRGAVSNGEFSGVKVNAENTGNITVKNNIEEITNE